MSAISQRSNGTVARTAGLVRSMPDESDSASLDALSIIRDFFRGRPKTLTRIIAKSEGYVLECLCGRKSMPLHRYVLLLLALPTEMARRSLQAIASRLGLTVSLSSERGTKDLRSEIMEAAASCGFAQYRVHQMLADRNLTPEEAIEIESVVREAQAQLEDIVTAVGPWVTR